MIELILNILALYAITIIVLGYVKQFYNKYIEITTNFLIILSTIFITFSIYLPLNIRQPEEMSKNFTAPFIILILFTILINWIITKHISQLTIKGIALIGMLGALFRLISY